MKIIKMKNGKNRTIFRVDKKIRRYSKNLIINRIYRFHCTGAFWNSKFLNFSKSCINLKNTTYNVNFLRNAMVIVSNAKRNI